MVRIYEEFWTRQEAAEYQRFYITNYPPRTLGTVLTIMRDRIAGMWVVSGHRFPTPG